MSPWGAPNERGKSPFDKEEGGREMPLKCHGFHKKREEKRIFGLDNTWTATARDTFWENQN